jgi:hypothetical protein
METATVYVLLWDWAHDEPAQLIGCYSNEDNAYEAREAHMLEQGADSDDYDEDVARDQYRIEGVVLDE